MLPVLERGLFAVPILLVLGGCAETVFSDADEGATRELRQGSSFSVSLPAGGSPAAGDPKIEGAFVRYLGRSLDEEGRAIYRFGADGAGEAVIHIPRAGSPTDATPAFVLRVLITRSSEAPRDIPKQSNKPY
jgi:hypothetical protein